MSLMGAASAVGQFVREQAGKLADAAAAGVRDAAAGGERTAETSLDGALAAIAQRAGDSPAVSRAAKKIGEAFSKPTSQALQPHIIAAAIAAVVAIAIIVYLARRPNGSRK